jgi:hypothetical protein
VIEVLLDRPWAPGSKMTKETTTKEK